MTGQEVVFVLLGIVMLGSALLVVTTRQLVHAVLWLVVCFGALAGGYLVLTAEFVAWVQVLIYVGAVVVLLLFGIMLTRAPIGVAADLDSGNRPLALAVAAATGALLVTVVVMGFGDARVPLEAGGGSAGEMGASVFRTWVLPFEVLSVLLLAALVGAIVLSRSDIGSRGPAGNGQVTGLPGGPREDAAEAGTAGTAGAGTAGAGTAGAGTAGAGTAREGDAPGGATGEGGAGGAGGGRDGGSGGEDGG